jgi:MFS family permease
VLGFSPLAAGFAFLPMTAVMFGMGRVLPYIAERFGNRRLLVGGLLLAFVGIAWLSRAGDSTAYFPLIAVPLTLLGLGMGVAFAPLTQAGIAGVAPRDAGAASGLVNVAQQLGGSLGLGILVTIFASASRSAAHDPVAGASHAAEAQHELAHAISTALTGSAVFMGLAVLVAVFVMRRPATVPAAAVAPAVAGR